MENVKFSQTYLWAGNENDIIVSFELENKEGSRIRHKVLVNDVEVVPLSDYYVAGETIQITVPKESFTNIGENRLKLIIIDEQENEKLFEYDIIKEDRDTFIMKRRLERDLSPEITENVKLEAGIGYKVNDSEPGDLVVQIPTEGKAKIKDLFVDADEDAFEDVILMDDMTLTEENEEGKMYEYEIDLAKTHRNIKKIDILEKEGNDEELEIHITRVAENSIQFLVSPDKQNWYGYDGEDWKKDYEMNREQLMSIPSSAWKSFIFKGGLYKHNLFIKSIFRNEIEGEQYLRGIEIEFTENEAPMIIDAQASIDEIHNEYTKITAMIKDMEGDNIEYRILIRKAEEEDFEEVDAWEAIENCKAISKEYNYPYFNPGLNTLRIEARDQRGKTSSHDINIVLLNEKPTLFFVFDEYKIEGVIGDQDGDKVTYRIFINDKMVFDYLPFEESPRKFEYKWNSRDMNIGEMNKVRIEVKDTHGGLIKEEFEVLGVYQGIMFKDHLGNYYTKDDGEILNWLDFGTMFGGQSSLPKKVIVENRTGRHIEDLNIEISDMVNALFPEEGEMTVPVHEARAELSLTEMPFEPANKIVIEDVLANEDTREFYIRITANRHARGRGEFKIKVESKPLDEE